MLLMSSRFQIDAPESTRRAVKLEAIRSGVLVSQLAVIALDYVTGLMAAGKTPAEVQAAIDRLRGQGDDQPAKGRRKKRPASDD